jgi:hypothetical protein
MDRQSLPGPRVAGLAGMRRPGAGHLDGYRGCGVAIDAVDDPGEILLGFDCVCLGRAREQSNGGDGRDGQAQYR